jgi:hypothetical protein
MRAEGKSLVRYLGVIVLGLIIVQAAIPVNVEASASVVPLTQLTPGAVLVVTSAGDDTFDKQPTNNEVIFTLRNKQSKVEKALFSDGRTIVVKVPDQAGSGIITLQKGGNLISTLNMSVSGATPDYFLITAYPIVFFLIFLIWLGISLKKDPNWHLGQALSEQFLEKVVVMDDQGKPVLKDGKDPIYYDRVNYCNSSSRLIAFIGLFVMATGILATLVPAVYRFALTGEVPDMGNFSTYLLAQTGIFAPYVTNKIVEGIKAPGANQGSSQEKR